MSNLNDYNSNISVFSFQNATPCLGDCEFYFMQISSTKQSLIKNLIVFLEFPDVLALKHTCKSLNTSINKKVIKEYIRRGCILPEHRKNLWISNIDHMKMKKMIGEELNDNTDSLYENIHSRAEIEKSNENQKFRKVVDEIIKDINRTFHVGKFNTEEGQQELKRVLTALAYVRPEIGYCQGMNFVAGALLFFIKDEDIVFWIFLSLLDSRELNSLYFRVKIILSFLI
jgi:hypothetical protein